MNKPKIGQVLGWMGKLSTIDIHEILAEQTVTHEKFGQIALSLGLCDAEHIWEAWCSQLALGTERVNLDEVSIDAHAVGYMPAELARGLSVMPIRNVGETMIVATSHPLDGVFIAELARSSGKQIRFVMADARQIEHALTNYYGAEPAEPAAHAAA